MLQRRSDPSVTNNEQGRGPHGLGGSSAAADQAVLAFAREAAEAVKVERAALLKSAGPERIHRARAAVRRLRTSILLLRAELGDEARDFRRPLKRLSRFLGEVRDQDVFLQTLAGLGENCGSPRPGIAATVQAKRASSQEALAEVLRADWLGQTLDRLMGWLDEKTAATEPMRAGTQADAGNDAALILRRSWRKLLKRAERMRHMGATGRHRVRIRARRLELAREILGPLVLASNGRPDAGLEPALHRFQSTLGDLNDIATAETRLHGMRAENNDRSLEWAIQALRKIKKGKKRRAHAEFKALARLKPTR